MNRRKKSKTQSNTQVKRSIQRAVKQSNAWIGYSNPPRLRSTDAICTIVQDMAGITITQAAGTATLGAISIQLAYFDNAGTIAALFDEYKFDKLQVTFRPHSTSNPLAVVTVIVPQLITVVDTDDAAAPTTLASLRENDSSEVSVFETQVRTFTPGSTTAEGDNLIGQWTDMALPNRAFFGVKYGVEAGNGGQTLLQVWSAQIRAQISLRHIR